MSEAKNNSMASDAKNNSMASDAKNIPMANYEAKLKELALKDERIVVMTAENRAAIRNLPESLGNRFIDTGITEQTMIGAAAGLAACGRIPITHALSTFLVLRAYEFIRTDVGISGLPVKLIGAVPGFLSDGNGPTHQAIDDIAVLRSIPPMNIFCPADVNEMVAGLEQVIYSPNPYYVRFNPRPAIVKHSENFKLGEAETLSEGTDVAILTYGMLFQECWQAKARLEARGISVRFVNVRTVKPLDEAAVLDAMAKTRLTVSVEDHFQVGGLYTILSEVCLNNRVSPYVMPIALDNHWFKPGRLNEVLEHEGFTPAQLAARIEKRFLELKN